jgi:peroxiredoxin
VGSALLALLVGFGCWLGYQLVRQNGRILLQLEGLEARIAAGLPAPPAPAHPAPAHPEGLPAGAPAPEFELPDLAGQRHALASFRGRKTLLIFFNPGCGFCSQMAPELARLPVDGAGGRPVPVVITTGDLERNRQLVDGHAISCRVLVDAQRDTAARYAADGTPTGYLVDEAGRIASPLAVGAQALLDLADGRPGAAASPPAEGNRPGAAVGSRDLANSRLERNGLKPGTPAPDFRLPTPDGGERALAEFRGRPLLLVFSDPHCGPCETLMPRLETLHRKQPRGGADGGRSGPGPGTRSFPLPHSPASALQLLLISRGEAAENQEKARQHQLTFPVVLQNKWEISKRYAMFATPVAYLIDEQGVIAAEVATGVEPILDLARRAMRGEAAPPEAREDAPAAAGRSGSAPGFEPMAKDAPRR